MQLDGMKAIPKAELHLHLEGSIEAETLIEIDPSVTKEEFAAQTRGGSFDQFLQGYIWVNKRLQRPELYALATRHLLERLAEENVRYAEITLSAGVVLWKQQSLAEVYAAIRTESLRSPISTCWILDAVRHFGAAAAVPVAEFAIQRRNDGVVAFGIGGDELRGPAEWFREIFQRARDGGLRLVCHAGETAGPESVWAALEIGAERIGHGTMAVKDPALLECLRRRNVPLEVCISSNVCTGVVPSAEEHPVRQAYDAGEPITLNTDDPAFFRTSLAHEYQLGESLFGLPPEEMAANSFRYAFAADRVGA